MLNITEPLELVPIFYSEISSSYMLFDFLGKGENCLIFLNYLKDNDLISGDLNSYSKDLIVREKAYKGKGSIDIYIRLKNAAGKHKIFLIEIKVHDYLSATPNQINTYMDAAKETEGHDDITFIYLTQFNQKSLEGTSDIILPGTINVFNAAKDVYPQRVFHITWDDFYNSLESDLNYEKNNTQQLMLELHKSWMKAQMVKDISENKANLMDRTFDYYFPTTPDRIKELEPMGNLINKGSATVLYINLMERNKGELQLILDIIKHYATSEDVNRSISYDTPPETKKAARDLLANLALDEDKWKLMAFYSEVFLLFNELSYLYLQGTGTRGFSIKLSTKTSGEISLCTLWRNLTLEFRMLR